jgi:hypothetical protein
LSVLATSDKQRIIFLHYRKRLLWQVGERNTNNAWLTCHKNDDLVRKLWKMSNNLNLCQKKNLLNLDTNTNVVYQVKSLKISTLLSWTFIQSSSTKGDKTSMKAWHLLRSSCFEIDADCGIPSRKLDALLLYVDVRLAEGSEILSKIFLQQFSAKTSWNFQKFSFCRS